jgi:hypothetical protein
MVCGAGRSAGCVCSRWLNTAAETNTRSRLTPKTALSIQPIMGNFDVIISQHHVEIAMVLLGGGGAGF